jgi:hypothetical protein
MTKSEGMARGQAVAKSFADGIDSLVNLAVSAVSEKDAAIVLSGIIAALVERLKVSYLLKQKFLKQEAGPFPQYLRSLADMYEKVDP